MVNMQKGISPLVASVLLIAITMAVAAILANFITGVTQQTLQSSSTCIGGSMSYATAEYPKWEASNSQIVAVVEAQYVSLGSFKFGVTLNNDTVLTYSDILGRALAAGSRGDIRTQASLPFAKADVKNVLITTNCTNVKTEATGLR